jgi:hypothetical protein
MAWVSQKIQMPALRGADPEIDEKLAPGKWPIPFAEVIRLRVARIRSAARTLTPKQRMPPAAERKKPDGPYLFDNRVRKVLGDPNQQDREICGLSGQRTALCGRRYSPVVIG